MLQFILDHSLVIIGASAIIFLGGDYYKRFFKKEDRLIEPEELHAAFFRIERMKRGHRSNLR